MKLLLDGCVDRRLARDLTRHETKTVAQMGWAGKKNGELLRLAENEFDAFITADRNLSFQQRLPQFNLAVIVLSAASNCLADLRPLVPKLLAALPAARPGEVVTIKS